MDNLEFLQEANKLLEKAIEKEIAEINRAIDERNRYHCARCGKLIEDWEEVMFEDDELIQTYKCDCGFYGDQHYKVQYDYTEEII